MTYRPVVSMLLFISVALLLLNCDTYKKTGLSITPTNATMGAIGDTLQFRAIETSTASPHPSTSTDVTSQVTWTSTNPAVATISSSGVATSVGTGATTITATTNGSFGVLTASTNLNATGHNLQSIAIIPTSQIVYATSETAQFIAIGTYDGDPTTVDLTDQVKWTSSDVNLATINASGLATAVSCPPEPIGALGCQTAITASMQLANGGTVASTTPSALAVDQVPGTSTLPSLTVYKVGLGKGTVVSLPQPPVGNTGIQCGAGAECTANFVVGSIVTLQATADAGSVFVGWSSNCIPDTPTTPPSGGTCSVTMANSETVGAIFNTQ